MRAAFLPKEKNLLCVYPDVFAGMLGTAFGMKTKPPGPDIKKPLKRTICTEYAHFWNIERGKLSVWKDITLENDQILEYFLNLPYWLHIPALYTVIFEDLWLRISRTKFAKPLKAYCSYYSGRKWTGWALAGQQRWISLCLVKLLLTLYTVLAGYPVLVSRYK